MHEQRERRAILHRAALLFLSGEKRGSDQRPPLRSPRSPPSPQTSVTDASPLSPSHISLVPPVGAVKRWRLSEIRCREFNKFVTGLCLTTKLLTNGLLRKNIREDQSSYVKMRCGYPLNRFRAVADTSEPRTRSTNESKTVSSTDDVGYSTHHIIRSSIVHVASLLTAVVHRPVSMLIPTTSNSSPLAQSG